MSEFYRVMIVDRVDLTPLGKMAGVYATYREARDAAMNKAQDLARKKVKGTEHWLLRVQRVVTRPKRRPVARATDEDLSAIWAKHWEPRLVVRAAYELGRKHGQGIG